MTTDSASTRSSPVRSRASTAKLGPGEHTIERATPRKIASGYTLTFSYRPADGSASRQYRVQARTVGLSRARAREKVEQLVEQARAEAAAAAPVLSPESSLGDYLDTTVRAELTENPRLAPRTRDQYRYVLTMLLNQCERHEHQHHLAQHSIADGLRLPVLRAVLREIADVHGFERARQTRTVVARHVITPLRIDSLVATNPLAEISLEALIQRSRAPRTRGGQALSRAEYDAVVEFLLNHTPHEHVTSTRGRYSLEVSIARRAHAVIQALLQVGTGLRVGEAQQLIWEKHAVLTNVPETSETALSFHLCASMTKTKTPRVAVVMDPRIQQALIQRWNRARPGAYVIGLPSDPQRPWRSGHTSATAELYQLMARTLQIPTLLTERSHLWRTTLHMLHTSAVPAEILDAQFGNSSAVRSRHYSDPATLAAQAQALLIRARTTQ